MASPLLAFALVALAVVLLPGADTVLVLRTSLREGPRAGVLVALGVVCGPILWGALAGLGVAVALSAHPLLHGAVAAAGGLYVGVLGVRALLSARRPWHRPATGGGDAPAPAGVRSLFLTGLMTNLLNPKIGAFYVSVMPGLFAEQDLTPWLGAALGAIHAALGLAYLATVAVLSGAAGRVLARPRALALVEAVCGVALLGFAAAVIAGAAARLTG